MRRDSHKTSGAKSWRTRAVALLGSSRFFYALIALFVLEAGWLAITGRYPMAYDESFHLGLIRLYSHRLLPFWSHQPDGPAVFGLVSRDPSYMYHYLLSFPYRWLTHFVHTEMIQVIILRLANVGLFGLGIALYRKVLLRTGASRALVHSVLAVFVLTPTVPFLAGQINYDNAVFPLLAVMLLLALKSLAAIKQQRKIPVDYLIWLAIVGLFASLVKYAFVPIFAAVGIWMAVAVLKFGRQIGWRQFSGQVNNWFKKSRLVSKLLLAVVLILLGGLATERYGVNIIRHQTPLPNCEQVISVNRCLAYGPYRRNFLTYQDKIQGKLAPGPLVPTRHDPFYYTAVIWLPLLGRQLFYALNGEASQFTYRPPLPVALVTSLVIGIAGLALFLWRQKNLRRQHRLNLLIFAGLIYLLMLWARNYADFHHLGVAYAIQARYLVLVLPIVYLLVGLGWAQALHKLPRLKVALAAVAISALLLEGGGAAVFIIRSDPSWYWPNAAIIRMNQSTQRLLKKFVIGA